MLDESREIQDVEGDLESILSRYSASFRAKQFWQGKDETDPLMEAFGLTPGMKRMNAQFWGRELGMCWERLVTSVCAARCRDYRPGLQIGHDKPCDLVLGDMAIDLKYRIGSGDSGTLKNLRNNGPLLASMGYRPVMMILREDNLPTAISAIRAGGWDVIVGREALMFIREYSGFCIHEYLVNNRGRFSALGQMEA